MHIPSKTALSALLALGASASAIAQIVTFNGSGYVTSNTNPAGTATDNATNVIGDANTDGRRIRTVTTSATAFTTYTGGPSFSIGAEAISYSNGAAATHPNSGALSFRDARLDPVASIPGTYDTMRFAATSSATGTAEDIVHGIMLFDLGASYTLADLTVSWTSDTAIALTTGSLRYAVNDNGTIRLSQNLVSLATALNGDNEVSNFSLSGLNWEAYNTAGIGTAGIYSPGTFSSLTSSNITQVGFYVDLRNSTNNVGAPVGIGWDVVTFQVGVIPEPSTYALIAGALGLAVVGLRRRRS